MPFSHTATEKRIMDIVTDLQVMDLDIHTIIHMTCESASGFYLALSYFWPSKKEFV